MKIIITSLGPEPDDGVDQRFGRGCFHILHDTEAGTYTALDNGELLAATQGAGVQAAQNVVASGAEVLLTGRCGPKAFDVLTAAGVAVYSGVTGSVAEAVEAWQKGALEKLAGPDGSPQH